MTILTIDNPGQFCGRFSNPSTDFVSLASSVLALRSPLQLLLLLLLKEENRQRYEVKMSKATGYRKIVAVAVLAVLFGLSLAKPQGFGLGQQQQGFSQPQQNFGLDNSAPKKKFCPLEKENNFECRSRK